MSNTNEQAAATPNARRRGRAARTAALAAVLTAGLAGCESPGITGGEAALPADERSPGFIDRISSQKNVSENDAFRGMLMLLDGEDAAATFEARVQALQERDVLPAEWAFQADRPLTRGRLAYMVHQACDVPGGVTLTLLGPTQRYCLRELQYRGFVGDGALYTPISGMEYVAVMKRADTYRRTGELPTIIKTTWRR